MSDIFQTLFGNFQNIEWQMVVMWAIGALLIFLAIKYEMEPALLLPMGFGAILVNLPLSGAITQAGSIHDGPITVLYNSGIANELFPLLLFIGIGAMIDFGPLLSNPKMMLFGAAAQFGIFFVYALAIFLGFDVRDAASTSIIAAIVVAAYSYMALVPIIQPPIIRLLTTKKERLIRMPYEPKSVSKTTKILFPIFVTVIAGLVANESVALVGFLMFGNLIRECGVLNNLSETAQKELANLITILLGLSVAQSMHYEKFVTVETLLIMGLGLVGFVFDTAGGVLFGKFLNLFTKKKVNPMIGAAGISAFPMSSRVVHKMGLKEDPTNFLLMHAAAANVSGQIASVVAGGLLLKFVLHIL